MKELYFILYTYIFLGILLLMFNKQISYFIYNLVLILTDKLKVKDLFIFRINDSNRNSMFFLSRCFVIIFGLLIVSFCLYFITKLN